jgi:hypothetical protein
MRGRVAALMTCTIVAAVSATALRASGAHAAASGRVYTLPFAVACAPPPDVVPKILGARAEVTVPAAWRTVRGSQSDCGSPALFTDRRGDGNECVSQEIDGTATSDRGRASLASAVAGGGPVLARGTLPTTSGMRGVWAEVNIGGFGPRYVVNAAYEAADGKVFYQLRALPPISYDHCPRGSASLARGIARELARSFRVDVTDPSTAEKGG